MRNIILKELTLQDWKAQNRHVVFGEKINSISGRNQAGKSTLMKAFYWLICGRTDSQTVANQDLYDNTKEIPAETPKASVTAIISIDGEDYKLQRVAEASFQRKRGTSEMVKSASDNYFYFVDDIARTKTDWQAWIEEHIAPEDMLQFVLDGQFFISKIYDNKKDARQIIEKLVGTVTREEMKGDYSCIDELLKKFSLDEIDARAQNLCKAIDQRLNEIPALINQKESEIAEIEQTDFNAVDKDIVDLEQQRTDLDKQMTDLTERIRPQMEAKHEAERAKQMKEDVFEKAYQEWKKSFDVRRCKLIEEINAIKKQNKLAKQNYDDALTQREAEIARQMNDIELLNEAEKRRETLLKERDIEKAREFDPSEAVCPFCHRQLEGEDLQLEKTKFEEAKRLVISKIVSQGKSVADEIKRLKDEIESLQTSVETPVQEPTYQPTEDLEKQLLEVANTDISKIAFMETEHGKALLDDIGSVVIPDVVMPDNSEIVEKKKEVNEALVPLYERRGLKSRLATLRNSVDGLRIEQKEKGAEMAQYELQRKAVKDFKQEQMEILSRKVNAGLKCSRISVWSQQKSGEMVPDLVLKDENGVSYATTNTANRIRITADIQRFFCERLGANLPLWLDEVSVLQKSNIPHYDGVQTFLLFCSETSLTIESK